MRNPHRINTAVRIAAATAFFAIASFSGCKTDLPSFPKPNAPPDTSRPTDQRSAILSRLKPIFAKRLFLYQEKYQEDLMPTYLPPDFKASCGYMLARKFSFDFNSPLYPHPQNAELEVYGPVEYGIGILATFNNVKSGDVLIWNLSPKDTIFMHVATVRNGSVWYDKYVDAVQYTNLK